MILPQDRPMLELLERLEIANSTLLDKLTYNHYKTTARRLKKLIDDKMVYRTRDIDTKGYLYGLKPFKKSPWEMQQIRHKNKRNELYMMLHEDESVKIVNAYREQIIDSIRPDLIVEVEREGVRYNLLVEVETGCKKANLNKYNEMYYTNSWARHFDTRPIVVWIMDQELKVQEIYYPYRHIKWDISNYNEIWT